MGMAHSTYVGEDGRWETIERAHQEKLSVDGKIILKYIYIYIKFEELFSMYAYYYCLILSLSLYIYINTHTYQLNKLNQLDVTL